VERLAATIEMPINHQGNERPPRKNPSLFAFPRLFQKANPITMKNERQKMSVSKMVKFISGLIQNSSEQLKTNLNSGEVHKLPCVDL
jgi:hypothetical protein